MIRRARICLIALPDAKGIERSVPCADVRASVRDGHATEVVPGGDRVAAVPEFLAVMTVSAVEHRLARVWNAPRGPTRKRTAVARPTGLIPGRVLNDLRAVNTAGVGEDDAVCDHRFLAEIHVTRQPRRRELPLALDLFELERGDTTVRGTAV